MEKLFSLYFCFKNNGSLALLLKKKKKVSDSRDEGIKLIGQMKVLKKNKRALWSSCKILDFSMKADIRLTQIQLFPTPHKT